MPSQPPRAPCSQIKERDEEYEKKRRELEGKLEAALAAEEAARAHLEAALTPSPIGDDEADGDDTSELLVANRLQLATLQAREGELEDLTAELAEMRATLAKAGGGDSALRLSCTILAKEMDYSERSFEEQMASERKLLQDALKAQVRACRGVGRTRPGTRTQVYLAALRVRRGSLASLSYVSRLFGCDGSMCGLVSCRHHCHLPFPMPATVCPAPCVRGNPSYHVGEKHAEYAPPS